MNIILRNPTEQACLALEALFTDPFYYSDATEDGDVDYTSDEASDVAIKAWVEQAIAQGIISGAEILEEADA
jgi:hypothetical protein